MVQGKPKAKAKPRPVRQEAFRVADPKCGTEAQQSELDAYLSSLTQAELSTVRSMVQRMTTGACINGDGSIDPVTGRPTTGGYRKSMHYIKAWFGAHPQAVQLP